jgi:hypothetical protein
MAVPAAAQRRTVMEGLAASANTIFVDTANVRVGIGTSSPTATLSVLGVSSFTSTTAGIADLWNLYNVTGIPLFSFNNQGYLRLPNAEPFTLRNGANTRSNMVVADLGNVVTFSDGTRSLRYFMDGASGERVAGGGIYQTAGQGLFVGPGGNDGDVGQLAYYDTQAGMFRAAAQWASGPSFSTMSLMKSGGSVGIGLGSSQPTGTLDVRGTIVGNSSVTASAFFGNGSALTGLSSAESNTYTSSKTFTAAVLGKSSITASAFFGDGSALTGIAGEANTYASSKTFTSDVLGKSSVTASGFFGNGSALTGLPVAQTTVTYNLSGATTETTTFKVCYGSGTLTTSAGTQVQVAYSGDITNSGAAGQYCVINFLQDGAFISPASSTIGMGKSNNASAGGSGNATTVRVFPSPGAGSHSWCVSMISPFGATCTFTSSAVLGNQFSVTELR